MRLASVIRLGLKEIRFSLREIGLIFLVLFIGFLALSASQVLQVSTDQYVQSRAREMFGAHVALRSRAPIGDQAIQKLKEAFEPIEETEVIDTVSMIRANKRALMANIRALEGRYPLLGVFERETEEQLRPGTAFIGAEIAKQLGVARGDSIRVGERTLEIIDVIREDSNSSRMSFGVLPRIYLTKEDLSKTKLIQLGSRVNYRRMYMLTDGSDKNIDDRYKTVRDYFKNSAVNIDGSRSAVRGLENGLKFANQFFSLMSLIVLLLCFLSGYYLLQVFLRAKIFNIGIYQCFGMSFVEVRFLYIFLLFCIVILASGLATAVSLPVIASVNASGLLPEGFQFVTSWQAAMESFLVALGCVVAFSVPLLIALRGTSTKVLLEESGPDLPVASSTIYPYLFTMIFFFFVSAWLFGSLKMAGLFLGLTLAFTVFAVFVLPQFMKLLSKMRWPVSLKLALLNLSKARFATGLFFIGIAFSCFFLTFVPHLVYSARTELSPPNRSNLPQLFVINIPEEDVAGMQAYLKDFDVRIENLSPFLLSRLLKKNDKPVEGRRFKRFPTRISYRDGLSDSETLYEGKNFSGSFVEGKQKFPYISMEYRYADRHGFEIGDRLTFLIQGLEVTGEIKNLRKVRWSSFQPNYFIQFQPGILEDFPKTYIGIIKGVEQSRFGSFKYEFINRFPRLTVIDLASTIEKLSDITRKFLMPIFGIGLIAFLIALIVSLSVLMKNLAENRYQIDLYKFLSGSYVSVTRLLLFEYGALFCTALVLGLGLSYFAAWYILKQLFGVQPHFAHFEAVAVAVVLFSAVLITVFSQVRLLLRARQATLL